LAGRLGPSQGVFLYRKSNTEKCGHISMPKVGFEELTTPNLKRYNTVGRAATVDQQN